MWSPWSSWAGESQQTSDKLWLFDCFYPAGLPSGRPAWSSAHIESCVCVCDDRQLSSSSRANKNTFHNSRDQDSDHDDDMFTLGPRWCRMGEHCALSLTQPNDWGVTTSGAPSWNMAAMFILFSRCWRKKKKLTVSPQQSLDWLLCVAERERDRPHFEVSTSSYWRASGCLSACFHAYRLRRWPNLIGCKLNWGKSWLNLVVRKWQFVERIKYATTTRMALNSVVNFH